MGKRRDEKEREIKLPDWAREKPWYQQEAVAAELVPVEQPRTPWYMEETKRAEAYMQVDSDPTDEQYFRKLISLLDDKGWNKAKINETVGVWLANQNHYRFVSMVRPASQDWLNTLVSLGVKADIAESIRSAIEANVTR